jgi:phosphohistidine swiveling domain-containing protein
MSWTIFERPASLHHLVGTGFGISQWVPKNFGFVEKPVLCLFKNGMVTWAEKDLMEDGLKALGEVRAKPELVEKIRTGWESHSSILMRECATIKGKNLGEASDSELLELYRGIDEANQQQLGWGLIWDHWDIALNHSLEKKLRSAMGEGASNRKFAETFSTLTLPPEMSFANREELALLEIAQRVRADERLLEVFESNNILLIEEKLPQLNAGINTIIDRHVAEFAWIRSGFAGAQPLKKSEVISLIAEHVREEDIGKRIREIKNRKEVLLEKKEAVLEGLPKDEEILFLANLINELGYLHDARKEAQMHFFLYAEQLLLEIGKRIGLSLEEMRWTLPGELEKWLENRRGNSRLCAERKKYSFFIFRGRTIREFYGKDALAKEREYYGKELEQNGIGEIAGMSACPGTVMARVRLLKSVDEIGEMRAGEALVTGMTTPEFVPAMRKAAAIITDEGGVLCHAAIVSRELGVPCVVGTKIATKVLKTGDLVEVRANHGIVKILG